MTVRTLSLFALIVAAASSVPSCAQAQATSTTDVSRRISIPRVLEFFEAEQTGQRPGRSASGLTISIARDTSRSARASVDSLLAGLESLALTSPAVHVRVLASGVLRNAADVGQPGVLLRIARITEQSADRAVMRTLILGLRTSRERASAAALLAQIAERAVEIDDHEDDGYLAVHSLQRMGPDGARELQRLYAGNAVGTAAGRALLESSARRGFGPPN